MYKTQIPSFPLRHYISCFWEGELVIGANQSHTHHAIANSKVELLFCYAGNYGSIETNGDHLAIPPAGIYGQTTTSKRYVSTAVKNGFFGVRLYAHALPLLFNMPAITLTNQQIDIDLLLKSQGAELADRIFESGSFEQRVNIVTGFFESFIYIRSARFARLEKLIFSLYQSAGFPSINELVNQSNLSQRQFERHFRDLTGFPAKTFLKIARFEKLVRTISCANGNSSQTLTAIALELGYYDQAHLNRQFKEFTGMSPSHYFRLQDVQDRL